VSIYPSAVVLLSGGMDSVAALHWARGRYETLRALGFRYGQPHANAELPIAQNVAARLGVPFTVLAMADVLNTRMGLLAGVTDHDASRFGGVNPAFVPGRNLVFLSVAAAHACGWFKGNFHIVIGACAEDAAGFPDCRERVLTALGGVLREGCGREFHVVAPFVRTSKAALVGSLDGHALEDVRRSWSCYRGELAGPCGTCSACVVRAGAFAAAGVVDLSAHPGVCGGDPARETRP